MRLIAGAIIVFVSVLGGYAAMGGKLAVLWQPFEVVIILGAAFGAFIIGNPKPVLMQALGVFGILFKGSRYDKQAYIDLLGLQFSIYRLIQSQGLLALEQHIENPEQSELFQKFPGFASNHHAVEFMCDYLRMITLGTYAVHELEALIDEELDTHHQEKERVVSAVQSLADATPALGIVAAVLGVIKTMGSITEPPEVLGYLIGGALVGTFLGVFCAYGFFGPMAQALRNINEAESKYFLSMKAGLIAHVSGYAPVIAVEFARKAVMSEDRPSFAEVDKATSDLKAAR